MAEPTGAPLPLLGELFSEAPVCPWEKTGRGSLCAGEKACGVGKGTVLLPGTCYFGPTESLFFLGLRSNAGGRRLTAISLLNLFAGPSVQNTDVCSFLERESHYSGPLPGTESVLHGRPCPPQPPSHLLTSRVTRILAGLWASGSQSSKNYWKLGSLFILPADLS